MEMDEGKINPSISPEPEPSSPTNVLEEPPATTPPPASTSPAPAAPSGVKPAVKSLETDTKIFAAISYLSILFIIPWVVKKEHPFVAFHVKQGMGLFIAEVVVWFVVWLIEAFLGAVFTYHAAGLVVVIYRLAWIVFGIVSLIGVYYALTGKEKTLPYLDVITKNIKV